MEDHMPPKQKTDREAIIRAAVDIVRESGEQALNARSIAAKLGSSTQPIFSNFRTMDELRGALIEHAGGLCASFMQRESQRTDIPAYKANGLALIRFAEEERELFKLLFMRDRRDEAISDDDSELKPIIEIIMRQSGLSEECARRLHLEMWIFVHGIASMIATNYIKWDPDVVSSMLTDVYRGLLMRYKEEKNA